MSNDEGATTPSGNPVEGELDPINIDSGTWSGQISGLLQQLVNTTDAVSGVQVVINLNRPQTAAVTELANALPFTSGVYIRQAIGNNNAVVTWVPDNPAEGVSQHTEQISLAEKSGWEETLGGLPQPDSAGNQVTELDDGIIVLRLLSDKHGVATWLSNTNPDSHITNVFSEDASVSPDVEIDLEDFNKCMAQNQNLGPARAFSRCVHLIVA